MPQEISSCSSSSCTCHRRCHHAALELHMPQEISSCSSSSCTCHRRCHHAALAASASRVVAAPEAILVLVLVLVLMLLVLGRSATCVLRQCTHAFECENGGTTTLSALASVFVPQAATGRSRDVVRPAGTALRHAGQRLQRGQQQQGQKASDWKYQGQVESWNGVWIAPNAPGTAGGHCTTQQPQQPQQQQPVPGPEPEPVPAPQQQVTAHRWINYTHAGKQEVPLTTARWLELLTWGCSRGHRGARGVRKANIAAGCAHGGGAGRPTASSAGVPLRGNDCIGTTTCGLFGLCRRDYVRPLLSLRSVGTTTCGLLAQATLL
jgi:hypothetical protein